MSESTYIAEVEIRNPEGLHMRPAMQFVDLASTFSSEISVQHEGVSVDAKSIMQMTMLAATCGAKLKIQASGDDASRAISALRELVDCQFGTDSGNSASAGKMEG